MLRSGILIAHVTTGTLGLVLGPIAMRATKRRGLHTDVGTIYHWNMLAVCVSAVGLAALDWKGLWWFVPIAVFSYANALLGFLAVKIRWRGWLVQHIAGMGGSYIALITALLVVNAGDAGLIVWFLPTIVGSPIIAFAIYRATLGPLRGFTVRRRPAAL